MPEEGRRAGPIDSVIAYRGGDQKFLYVADSLFNDLTRNLRTMHPRFPSVPSEGVPLHATSASRHGVVGMPVRGFFVSPVDMLPLWHEVGGYAWVGLE